MLSGTEDWTVLKQRRRPRQASRWSSVLSLPMVKGSTRYITTAGGSESSSSWLLSLPPRGPPDNRGSRAPELSPSANYIQEHGLHIYHLQIWKKKMINSLSQIITKTRSFKKVILLWNFFPILEWTRLNII